MVDFIPPSLTDASPGFHGWGEGSLLSLNSHQDTVTLHTIDSREKNTPRFAKPKEAWQNGIICLKW